MKYASWAANQINRAYQVSTSFFYDTLNMFCSSFLQFHQLVFKRLDTMCKSA